jgi:hypothetical protein
MVCYDLGMNEPMPQWRLELLNPELFWKKIVLVSGTMLVLVPLVLLKTRVPAVIYVSLLLAIHLLILVVYLYRVEWRQFSRIGLAGRIVSVLIFSYLLAKVKFSAGPEVLLSIAAAFTLHIAILATLMMKVVRR